MLSLFTYSMEMEFIYVRRSCENRIFLWHLSSFIFYAELRCRKKITVICFVATKESRRHTEKKKKRNRNKTQNTTTKLQLQEKS